MKIRILISLFILIIISCSKKKGCTDILSIKYDSEAEKDDGSCEYGGLGGKNTIVIYLWNHGQKIISKSNYLDSAYVKYNAFDAPEGDDYHFGGNPNAYDTIFTGNIGDSSVKINGLKKGKYFVYVTGTDTTLQFGERVTQKVSCILLHDSEIVILNKELWQICCVF